MRIKSLNLDWFRGASSNVPLECNAKSVVVYGANGSGKSSFADALEYIVSNGKIHHLAHEYSGKKQEKGIRNTHAPENDPSRIKLNFNDGSSIEASIAPGGKLSIESNPAKILSEIQDWDLERFILRQDEVANFIHATKGKKYSVLLPLLGLEGLEQSAENIRLINAAVQDRSDLNTKKQHSKSLATKVSEYLPKLTLTKARQALIEIYANYIEGDAPSKFDELIAALRTEIDRRISSAEPVQQRYMLLKQIHDESFAKNLAELKECEKQASKEIEELMEKRIAVLEPTIEFVDTIEPEKQVVECPACGREIVVEDFYKHVRKELESLSSAREVRKKAINARKKFAASVEQLKKRVRSEEISKWLDHSKRKELREAIGRVIQLDLNAIQESWSKEIWKTLNSTVPVMDTKVKNAIKRTPPSTQELIQSKDLLEACEKIPDILSLKREISKIDTLINCLEDAELAVRRTIKTRTEKTITEVSEEIQRLWAILHPDEQIEGIALYTPGDVEKAVDISLKFFGVDQPSPRLTLSEGHRNSLGLCIFLALVLREEEDRPIVLDDVVSSLDREHRGMLAKVLMDDLSGRQVVLLTHDREWFSELRMRLPAKEWEFRVLRPWENPKVGIQWARSTLSFDDARVYEKSDPEAAGNRVRSIMDTQLAIAAENLKVSVNFLRGDKNDRRTCVEFLERITSEAKDKYKIKANGEWHTYRDPIEMWKNTRTLLISWANRASHTGTLVKTEVKELIDTCEETMSHFWCKTCKDPVWISDQEKRKRLQCSCGELQWRYG